MNTQEIINELTKYNRLAIREALEVVYSKRYLTYMFSKGRKRTDLFRKTVKAKWECEREFKRRVESLIKEYQKSKEVTI